MLRGGFNYIYTKQGLGMAAADSEKRAVKKIWGWAQMKEDEL